ncbi:MAG: lytic transglycosylase domain-containing protein [Blastocatellia bacterium]|nr:lytic transglycosylase domain-containing protein [Blastocatellia bacterium]
MKAQNKPLTYVEIITALNTKVPNQAFKNKMEIIDYIIRQVNFVGIEGELTPDVEKLLWQAGASDQLMKAIKVKSQSSIKSKPNGTSAKTYLEMSENEKRDFIEVKTNEFLDKFGRTEADKIPTKAVNSIKMFVGDYLRRISVDEETLSKGNSDGMISKNTCLYGRGNLANVLKRGTSYSRNIVESFVNKGVQPEVGIYIAFIESEFCPCLQAPTGPLGMFQLTTATASNYGVKAIKGASPESPDERCNPKAAAFGAAAYIKMMSDKFYGKDVNGIYFTVAAFNSGEGGLNKNIRTVREIKNGKQNVTFGI